MKKKIFLHVLWLILQTKLTIQSDEFELSFEAKDSFEEKSDEFESSFEAKDSFEEMLDNLDSEEKNSSGKIYGGREAKARKH